jgi:histidinol-phosphate aminotransferase
LNSFDSLIREDLRQFKAYYSARREADKGSIFLNANESPWENNISLNALVGMNRYPEPQPEKLIAELSKLYEISSNQMLLTSGSDIGIDLLMRLFCCAGRDSILTCPPTYGMYEVSARLQGANVIFVDLIKNLNFSINLEGIESAWNPSVKLIFLCSPNNPTGNLLNKDSIFELCKKYSGRSLIVIDEAYIEYAKSESFIKKIHQYENLVVLRTFSKALSSAGIRCGALIAHEDLICLLNKIITPYPISILTLKAALQVLSKENYLKIKNQILLIQSEREKLINFFNQCTWVNKVWESQANFILIECQESKKILEKCMKNGILLRNMQDKPGLKDCVRISIGSPKENDFLTTILSN